MVLGVWDYFAKENVLDRGGEQAFLTSCPFFLRVKGGGHIFYSNFRFVVFWLSVLHTS